MKYKSRLNKPHNLPGTLICVEGIDGSGKSTQLAILRDWLNSLKQDVIFTEWNSSDLISQTTKLAKKKNLLSPRTFSLLHAVDFADRLEQVIIPALKAGFIVLADRYVYTAFSRDVARGVDRDWVRKVYGFAVKPDLTMYFRVTEDVSLERICSNRSYGTCPAVSTAVWMPFSLQAFKILVRNSICSIHSPPEKVTPPPEFS